MGIWPASRASRRRRRSPQHKEPTPRAAGRARGLLHGVPLAIKDLFWTKGVPTAAGTTIHRGFVPTDDATAVARLKTAGAVLLGKLQMTEGAYRPAPGR